MRTVQEVMDWIEEESKNSLQNLRDENHYSNGHLATAYSAEYDMLEKLKEFIISDGDRYNVTQDKRVNVLVDAIYCSIRLLEGDMNPKEDLENALAVWKDGDK